MLRYIKRQIRKNFGRDKEFYSRVYSMIGIVPDNIEIYKLAMIHRSASVELPDGTMANNERLEFLGDAVLEAVVSEFLFVEYPENNEGTLTQLRSRLVSRASLDNMADSIGLGNIIVVNCNGTSLHKHLLGNALEALIGAIYLDKGYDYVNRFIIEKLLNEHTDIGDLSHTETDFKSRLIEWCQKSKREIRFRTVHDTASCMQKPVFMATIIIDGIELGYGSGGSKKEAEQQAACSVTRMLTDEIGDYLLDTIDTSLAKLSCRNDEDN